MGDGGEYGGSEISTGAETETSGMESSTTESDVGELSNSEGCFDTAETEENTSYENSVVTYTETELTDRTVTPDTFEGISQRARSTAFNYAGEHCPDRKGEFESRGRETATNAHLSEMPSENILGYHTTDTNEVYVSDELTEKAAMHTALHEYTHEASYREKTSEYSEKDHTITESRRSGLSIYSHVYSSDTGNLIESESKNVGLNEGITEEYTLRASYQNGIETGGVEAYSTNREYATEIESMVGSDIVSDAYYNGMSDELADRINELGKDENTWSDINRCLDTINEQYTNPTAEQIAEKNAAFEELNGIIDRMNNTRVEEIFNETENS